MDLIGFTTFVKTHYFWLTGAEQKRLTAFLNNACQEVSSCLKVEDVRMLEELPIASTARLRNYCMSRFGHNTEKWVLNLESGQYTREDIVRVLLFPWNKRSAFVLISTRMISITNRFGPDWSIHFGGPFGWIWYCGPRSESIVLIPDLWAIAKRTLKRFYE